MDSGTYSIILGFVIALGFGAWALIDAALHRRRTRKNHQTTT